MNNLEGYPQRDKNQCERGRTYSREYTYALTSVVSPSKLDSYYYISRGFQRDLAYKLAERMHNDAATYPRLFGIRRCNSAFYVTTPENTLKLVYGLTDDWGRPIYHDYLREQIPYVNYAPHSGYVVRSGHYSKIKFAFMSQETRVALFDSLRGDHVVQPHHGEYRMITIMFENDIFPITSDGRPVQIAL
jgi:hypothetical protein